MAVVIPIDHADNPTALEDGASAKASGDRFAPPSNTVGGNVTPFLGAGSVAPPPPGEGDSAGTSVVVPVGTAVEVCSVGE